MKKKLVLVLAFLLTFSITVCAFANSNDPGNAEKRSRSTCINEYDMIKSYKLKSDDKLKKEGFTESQIQHLKTIDVKEELNKRAKLDPSILRNLGYNEEQMKILNTFKGTEEEMRALSGNLTLNVWEGNHKADSSGTWLYINFNWKWSVRPFINDWDVIAFGWAPGFMARMGNSLFDVFYKNPINGNVYRERISNERYFEPEPGGGCWWKFLTLSMDPENRETITWAQKGQGRVYVVSQDEVKVGQVKAVYGYNTLKFTPSVSIDGVSITFSKGIEKADMDFFDIEWR